jgi:hypothetical protein
LEDDRVEGILSGHQSIAASDNFAAAFVREVVETLLYVVEGHHVRDFYADVYSIPVASMRIQLVSVDWILIPTWSSDMVPVLRCIFPGLSSPEGLRFWGKDQSFFLKLLSEVRAMYNSDQ